MLRIHRRYLKVDLPQEAPGFLGDLKKDSSPLIASMRREYWNRLGLPAPEQTPSSTPFSQPEALFAGDIFLDKKGNIIYFKIPSSRDHVECGFIGKEGDAAEFEAFCTPIKEGLQRELHLKDLEWSTGAQGEEVEQIRQKGTAMKPSREELAAARELEEPLAGKLIQKAMSSQNLSLSSLLAGEDKKNGEALVERLVKLGLLGREFVVLCKERGQQIIKVTSREAIDETSQKGFKCFLCGKPISEERLEELINCTDMGIKMTVTNAWMPVRAVDALSKIGFRENEIVVEHEEDNISLYLRYNGETILFFLLNKKFAIQDGYLFNAKVGAGKIQCAILVSSQKVPSIMKNYLAQSNKNVDVYSIESFSGLEDKISQVLEERQQQQIKAIMDQFSSLTSVDIKELVAQKIFPQEAPGKKGPRKEENDKEKPVKGKGKERDSSEEEAKEKTLT